MDRQNITSNYSIYLNDRDERNQEFQERELERKRQQQEADMDEFCELNGPRGYYKPFYDPSSVKVWCFSASGYETDDYWYPE
jgi:hypothetical protein